jgi:hypothetical protein
MNLTTLPDGKLHQQADATRREIEGYKLTNNITQLGEAKAHLTEIENEIKRRKESQ